MTHKNLDTAWEDPEIQSFGYCQECQPNATRAGWEILHLDEPTECIKCGKEVNEIYIKKVD